MIIMMMIIIIELQRGQRSCKALFRAIFVLFFNTVHLVMSEKSPVKGQLSFFLEGRYHHLSGTDSFLLQYSKNISILSFFPATHNVFFKCGAFVFSVFSFFVHVFINLLYLLRVSHLALAKKLVYTFKN